jgi:hypothetical protein
LSNDDDQTAGNKYQTEVDSNRLPEQSTTYENSNDDDDDDDDDDDAGDDADDDEEVRTFYRKVCVYPAAFSKQFVCFPS